MWKRSLPPFRPQPRERRGNAGWRFGDRLAGQPNRRFACDAIATRRCSARHSCCRSRPQDGPCPRSCSSLERAPPVPALAAGYAGASSPRTPGKARIDTAAACSPSRADDAARTRRPSACHRPYRAECRRSRPRHRRAVRDRARAEFVLRWLDAGRLRGSEAFPASAKPHARSWCRLRRSSGP